MADVPPLLVTVAYSPEPREVRQWPVRLSPGATVLDALRASGMAGDFPALQISSMTVGVWGKKAAHDQLLADGDRVEVCRPLRVDPKVARRERFRLQGTRSAGLFASRRPGAKPGY
jgi:putative ubiquitin-RnfH superfamily antitoxin RatB of RatAB toxin-antitoxin module